MSEDSETYDTNGNKKPVDHVKINTLILDAQEAVSMLDWIMETKNYRSLKLWHSDLQKATKELEQEILKLDINYLEK